MGLSNGEDTPSGARPGLDWLVPGTIVLLVLALLLSGDSGGAWLRFDRTGIAAGEAWRLVTGHLVHLGVSHALLNLAGLVLVWILVGHAFRWKQWLWVIAGATGAIDIGLWFGAPSLEWYVGLSGLLHGMLAAGILAGLANRSSQAVILAIFLTGKLAWEQLAGALPGSEATAGGAVIVDAHLYGAIGGALAAALLIRVGRAGSI